MPYNVRTEPYGHLCGKETPRRTWRTSVAAVRTQQRENTLMSQRSRGQERRDKEGPAGGGCARNISLSSFVDTYVPTYAHREAKRKIYPPPEGRAGWHPLVVSGMTQRRLRECRDAWRGHAGLPSPRKRASERKSIGKRLHRRRATPLLCGGFAPTRVTGPRAERKQCQGAVQSWPTSGQGHAAAYGRPGGPEGGRTTQSAEPDQGCDSAGQCVEKRPNRFSLGQLRARRWRRRISWAALAVRAGGRAHGSRQKPQLPAGG
ncbi:hypothetical protein BDY21DRAFT_183518 [Lineolata rhizophorae]|uniref:Uncharacterized protein n=1 Tax=Lineolata rhizophorae TaxID=578093 RepID=A0A6A6P8D6_9PEZI|nr:hypothetical protein BDY21DRAFT_183518 [Lineolata rhizophorae]